jgi:hypothetical protein
MPKLEGTSNQELIGAAASADGIGSSKGASKVRRAAKSRKFYILRSQARSRPKGLKLINGAELFGGRKDALWPPEGRRGFRDYPVAPLYLLDAKRGRTDRDFEDESEYWLITDRMKSALEEVDPAAFAFLKCDTQLPDGTEGPRRWLCDVVCVLDALDEEKSIVKIGTADNGSKVYKLFGRTSLIFDTDAVGPHHVFRMKYFQSAVICDEELKRVCKVNKLTGMRFDDAAEGMI